MWPEGIMICFQTKVNQFNLYGCSSPSGSAMDNLFLRYLQASKVLKWDSDRTSVFPCSFLSDRMDRSDLVQKESGLICTIFARYRASQSWFHPYSFCRFSDQSYASTGKVSRWWSVRFEVPEVWHIRLNHDQCLRHKALHNDPDLTDSFSCCNNFNVSTANGISSPMRG